jgi:hypothetical protein
MTVLTFNFHNLSGVQIESDDPIALKFFESEYRNSAGSLPLDARLVRLKWIKNLSFRPSGIDFHFQKHKCLARWSYKIARDEMGFEIEALGNRLAIPMVHHMLVHPCLRYLCALSNTLMLHGSAVVFQNQSLIFTGAGGVGKTTISSLLLHQGGEDWKLHADDYVFLSAGSESFSYITRSHLYRNQIRWVPSIKNVLTKRERLHLEFFGRLREFTRDGIKWPLRVESSRLWPDHAIAPHATLGAIILLSRGDLDGPVLERIEAEEEVIDNLVKMNFTEARHFIELIRRDFDEIDFKNWLHEWEERERILLIGILKASPLFRLELPPSKYASDQYGRQLLDLLLPILSADINRGPNG